MKRNSRRGTAVIEFALIAPVFLLLVFGMIEFGRAIMVQQVLVNVSREGARQAAVDGGVIDVDAYLAASAITGALTQYEVNGVIVSDLSGAEYGEAVTVRISVPYRNVSWLPTPNFLTDTVLSASTTMRRETSS